MFPHEDCNHFQKDASKREHFRWVTPTLLGCDFRGTVHEGKGIHVAGGRSGAPFIDEVSSNAKICENDIVSFHENVCWFDVTMPDPLGVDVCKTAGKAAEPTVDL